MTSFRRRCIFAAVVLVASVTREAVACPWDDETFHAEGSSLPCAHDAVLGTFARHSKEFYEARIAASDAVLEWDPRETAALDRKGIALLKLRRFEEAERVMLARLAVTPNAYAAHANLGTVYTFTGQLDKALRHIDRAMAIDPKAHFGREKFHRQLVVYLQDLAAGRVKDTENFLRIPVTNADRASGANVLKARGVAPDTFDALVSMITVYGADEVPHVYVTLGDLLALRGSRRLAWAAYERAREMKHPSAPAIARWQAAIDGPLKAAQKARSPAPTIARGTVRDAYRSLKQPHEISTDTLTSMAVEEAAKYTDWERKQVAAGLEVWTNDGLATLYREAHKRIPRCKTPAAIDDGKESE